MPNMAGPMDGISVVELGVWVAGPATGGILGDWGADVVKIEPPTGDPARMFGPHARARRRRQPPVRDGQPVQAQRRHRPDNRRGPSHCTRIDQRRRRFITNVRPGALRRLGLDYEALARTTRGWCTG